jgi:hypothetical protein
MSSKSLQHGARSSPRYRVIGYWRKIDHLHITWRNTTVPGHHRHRLWWAGATIRYAFPNYHIAILPDSQGPGLRDRAPPAGLWRGTMSEANHAGHRSGRPEWHQRLAKYGKASFQSRNRLLGLLPHWKYHSAGLSALTPRPPLPTMGEGEWQGIKKGSYRLPKNLLPLTQDWERGPGETFSPSPSIGRGGRGKPSPPRPALGEGAGG